MQSNCLSITNIGINELNNVTFKVYPNPTRNQITLSIDQNSVQKIVIVDINGKVVNSLNATTNTVTVSNLEIGIYFIQVYTTNGILRSKFIKE